MKKFLLLLLISFIPVMLFSQDINPDDFCVEDSFLVENIPTQCNFNFTYYRKENPDDNKTAHWFRYITIAGKISKHPNPSVLHFTYNKNKTMVKFHNKYYNVYNFFYNNKKIIIFEPFNDSPIWILDTRYNYYYLNSKNSFKF